MLFITRTPGVLSTRGRGASRADQTLPLTGLGGVERGRDQNVGSDIKATGSHAAKESLAAGVRERVFPRGVLRGRRDRPERSCEAGRVAGRVQDGPLGGVGARDARGDTFGSPRPDPRTSWKSNSHKKGELR